MHTEAMTPVAERTAGATERPAFAELAAANADGLYGY